jgi:hypothetical protein
MAFSDSGERQHRSHFVCPNNNSELICLGIPSPISFVVLADAHETQSGSPGLEHTLAMYSGANEENLAP